MKQTDSIIALVAVIVLAIVLTHTYITDSLLGRCLLVAAVVTVAAINKIAGVVAVLVVIVAVQQQSYTVHSYNFYEGFNNNTVGAVKKAAPKLGLPAGTIMAAPKLSKEGFCLSDKESTMLRGKQSNSIPVSEMSRTEINDVSPSSKSVFSGDFALV